MSHHDFMTFLNGMAVGAFIGSIIPDAFRMDKFARIARSIGFALLASWMYWK